MAALDPFAGPDECQDRCELRELPTRFFRGLDDHRHDEEFLRSIFVESATVEFPAGEYAGIHEIAGGCTELVTGRTETLHGLSDHVLTLRDDSAHIAATLFATYLDESGEHLHLGAHVGAEAMRAPAGWRICRLAIGIVWTERRLPQDL